MTVYCPHCGAENETTDEDWQRSICPERVALGTLITNDIGCWSCRQYSVPAAWHRAYERRELLKRGAMTLRMRRELVESEQSS